MSIKKGSLILVRSEGVSFRTTAGDIREGVGNYSNFNTACALALEEMERCPEVGSRETRGVVGTWRNIAIQLDIV